VEGIRKVVAGAGCVVSEREGGEDAEDLSEKWQFFQFYLTWQARVSDSRAIAGLGYFS